MSTIGDLASTIYDNEIGYETGSSRASEVSLVSGWLLGHLGELNNYIYTCFSGENPTNLGLEEQAIITEMYLSNYNRKAHRTVLRGIDGTTASADWHVIREGDSMIQKSNKNQTAQSYHSAYKSAEERLGRLVYAYNLYGARPSQVAGTDAPISGSSTTLDGYYN